LADALPHPDRRQSERRGYARREEDRRRRFREVAATTFALCGAFVVIYLFFAIFGAVDVGQAAVASGIAILLAVIWLAGFWQRRVRGGDAIAQRPDRERRGF